MKNYPYALATDGSNDNGLEKMNPLTVRIFDVNAGKVKTSLLDMCMTPSGTALDIFNAIDRCMTLFDVPWSNCVAVGVENTNVNMGNRHSIKTMVPKKHPDVFFNGCQCHVVHMPHLPSPKLPYLMYPISLLTCTTVSITQAKGRIYLSYTRDSATKSTTKLLGMPAPDGSA